jgi:hypothetical protein
MKKSGGIKVVRILYWHSGEGEVSSMNCADFQRVLPEVMESGGGVEETAHLRSCVICSDLIQDLKYIAEAARMLVPMEDPSPRVWASIEQSLEREGLIRPSRGTVRLEPFLIPGVRPRNVYGWAGIAALALVAISMLVFNRLHTPVSAGDPTKSDINITQGIVAPAADVSEEDKPLISAIAKKDPAMGETYKKKLHNAEAYIYDARRALQQDPGDGFARQQLMNAYQQRQMVYESAVSYTTR